MGRNENTLCNSTTKSYQNGELSTSQEKAVIKLIEKKDKDKKHFFTECWYKTYS